MNIFMVYTKGIAVEKEGIKKPNSMITCKFYRRRYRWNLLDGKIYPWIYRRKTFVNIYRWHYEGYYNGIQEGKLYDDMTFLPTKLLTALPSK